jgi:hypothetical protein
MQIVSELSTSAWAFENVGSALTKAILLLFPQL